MPSGKRILQTQNVAQGGHIKLQATCKVDCQNWYMYTIDKNRETWEDREVEGNTSFTTFEYRTGLQYTIPELEEEK